MKKLINPLVFLFVLALFSTGCNHSGNSNPTTVSCSDGIKNQNETDIDCGGPCQACLPTGNYLTGQLAGVTTSAAGSNTALPSGSDYWGTNGANRVVYAGGVWYSPSYTVNGSLIMHKNFLNHGASFTATELYSLYAPATYGYCTDVLNSEGIELSITDSNGSTWTSTGGDNTGSTFTISSRGSYSSGSWSTTIEGTFSCKVYRNGSVKTFAGNFRSTAGLQ